MTLVCYWLPIQAKSQTLVQSLDSNNGNLVFVGQGDHFLAVEHQCLSGTYAETGCPSCGHRLNCRPTNDGHVKPHVLTRLGQLEHRQRPATESNPIRSLIVPQQRTCA